MTCKDLSSEVVTILSIVTIFIILTILTATQIVSWLTENPVESVECIDGRLYEVTYKGNIKIMDEHYGDICEVKAIK